MVRLIDADLGFDRGFLEDWGEFFDGFPFVADGFSQVAVAHHMESGHCLLSNAFHYGPGGHLWDPDGRDECWGIVQCLSADIVAGVYHVVDPDDYPGRDRVCGPGLLA